MPWARPRLPLLIAALLDASGLVVLGLLFSYGIGDGFGESASQVRSFLTLVAIYCSLGWLFGSYTLLKLRSPTWIQALARLSTTSIASVILAIAYGYIFRLQITSSLFFRSNLIPQFIVLALWSGLVRWVLRRHWPQRQRARWHIVALEHEIPGVIKEWSLCQPEGPLPTITDVKSWPTKNITDSEALALSAGVINDPALRVFCQEAVSRGQPVYSVVDLAEQEFQRIPCRWIEHQWLLFSGGIDGQRTTLQKQFKRYADVVVSLALLLITSPVLLVAFVLVKLQDGGTLIYKQRRTGLFGKTFYVLKIRSMSVESGQITAQWAKTNDARITPVGRWLRRTRLDELPQLINVLRGEMSLIGPRPEQPELEHCLEENIPNYRLRHWMRPGLSGWAQVNMPYTSSISDTEKKLSYDLFYIKNSTIWLDLLILFKTIKIVLKGAGR
ncbi:exopolysaccharide biosynthesis polyprenyl glycosylphosphotransferase [Synechococcus sp. HK05]|uniref:exopolysaccharide biosynthesis polyprenyl glycosylphosphotransferase n=1 Tax=Synechococcus sp. HK05 TaxID=2725975 RepID=UPI001C386FA1|nr:exopolysaccharide biosynthesis polyprenyl glycosylphosphotransferase [Synechococcus sp. HK05]MBV2352185.1 exopolysaccharide biosynthesis polyprenyl glycosylphosphotransferase [Synechococcus sp. HK05]